MSTSAVSGIYPDKKYYQEAVELLKHLIATPSFSREESETAGIIEKFLASKNIQTKRELNNVWAIHPDFREGRTTLLLNSHHDTVKPNAGYNIDPFHASEQDGKLFGLGSNDAGGPLVALLAAFCLCHKIPNLPFNLLIAATAEEEISGHNGVEYLLPSLPPISCGIVGEPTLMNMAVAEKGLMVLDCTAHGKAGHAARNEGINAIYKAMKDIEWLSTFQYEKTSELLGDVHTAVTAIETINKAHNVVPSTCHFTVDVRVNERYSFDEVLEIIRSNIDSQVTPRSTRLQPSFIGNDHPLVQAGKSLGYSTYGSPTCSDQALMNFPTLKLGPGDSARSHMADEYIYLREIEEGINGYCNLVMKFGEIIEKKAS